MSWSPELIIGELRPWPDSVNVVRGGTDETRQYVPQQDASDAESAELRELVKTYDAALGRACKNFGYLVHRYVTQAAVDATTADLQEIRMTASRLGIEVGNG